MKKWIYLFALLVCVSWCLVLAVMAEDKIERPSALSITEKFALKALQERQQSLSDDVKAFSGEVCRARGIMVMEECNIDPQGMTVSRVPKKEEPKK